MINTLRTLLQQHDPRPLAAAFAAAGHAPGARILLALEEGLLSTPQTAEALHGITPVPTVQIPPVPEVPGPLREMWLRLQAGRLLAGVDTEPAPATQTALIHPDLQTRLQVTQDWSRSLNRPLTVCMPDYGGVLQVQAMGQDVEVITSEELWSLLAASRPGRLRALARLAAGCVMVDGTHRLDPRGLDPFTALLGSLSALGTPVLFSGPYKVPRVLYGKAQTLQPAAALPEASPLIHHGTLNKATLTELLAQGSESTLVILPSRFAALDLLGQLPAGARLLSRTLTAEHLWQETAGATQPSPFIPTDQRLPGAHLTLSTWGSANPSLYRRVIHLQAPLPILADHAWTAGRLEFAHVPEYRLPAASVTAAGLTLDLLEHAEPFCARTMQAYWETLLPHTQRDSLGIEKLREQLDYPAVSAAARALFGGAVTVLVDQPGAEQEVARARRTGRMLPFGPFTAKLSPASLKLALEDGRAEQVGDAVIWTGPYSDVQGVGLP